MIAHHCLRLAQALMLAALSCGIVQAAQSDAVPAVAEAVGPSTDAFDTLLRRLELGDLATIGPLRAQPHIEKLQSLLPANDAHRRRLLDSLRCVADYSNAYRKGYDFADAQLAQAQAAHDVEAAIRFYYCRGNYQEGLKTARDALADYERGIVLARSANDEALLAVGLEQRGSVYSLLGIYGKALADLLDAQHLFTKHELGEMASEILLDIGITYRRLGQPEKAIEYLSQSVDNAQRRGNSDALLVSTLQLGYAQQETGHAQIALATLERALALGAANGDPGSVGASHVGLASVHVDLHNYARALADLDLAQKEFGASDDNASMGMVHFERGRALQGLGDPHKALAAFAQAQTVFDASGNQRYLEMLHKARAATLEALGRPAAALAELRRYIEVHDAVARERANQQAQMLREQFETDRAELDNARLRAEQALREREVQNLRTVRHWQQVALGLLAIVLALLGALAVRQLLRLRKLKHMAALDPLTGVANLRGVAQFSAAAVRNARQEHRPLAFLAIDVDEFKRINDAHGHLVGDRVLVKIARTCAQALRDGDLLGRTGGEEFLAVLPDANLAQAVEIAERLRRKIESLQGPELPAGIVTGISVGVAELRPEDQDATALRARADAALYRAKSQGRNRVLVAES